MTFRVVANLVESSAAAYYPALLIMMAIVAAIMSTADSCLLSVSSIFTKDFLARRRGLTDQEAESLTRWPIVFSVVVMVVLVFLANLRVSTLWGLLVVKFEILIQLSPAFVLGTMHSRDDRRAFAVQEILVGLATGLVVTLALYVSGWQNVYGFQAGAIGVVINYGVVIAGREIRQFRAAQVTESLDARSNVPAVTGR